LCFVSLPAAFDGCRDAQCGDLSDEAACTSSKLGCKFFPELFRCFDTSGPTCNDFNFLSKDACEKSGECSFDVGTSFCVTKGSEIPCQARGLRH